MTLLVPKLSSHLCQNDEKEIETSPWKRGRETEGSKAELMPSPLKTCILAHFFN